MNLHFLLVTLTWAVQVYGQKPDIIVEAFTCKDYATPDGTLEVGRSIYTDTNDWTIKSWTGMHADKIKDTFIIQTAQADADATDPVLARCVSAATDLQYILAIPAEVNPDWLKQTSWTQMPGATIVVDANGENESFKLFQKKYKQGVSMTMGPIGGSDGKMAFILYTRLENNHDSGVTATAATPPQATCSATGDPHYVGFAGNRFDFGDGAFHHMLVSKDCLFDVQVMAATARALMSTTAIRFHSDVFVYNHGNGVLQQKKAANSKSVVQKLGGNKYKLEDVDLGISVTLGQGGAGTTIVLQSGYYMENANGLCGVANSHPYKDAALPSPNVCGGTGSTTRHKDPVHAQNVLATNIATWDPDAKLPADTCAQHYCVDPTVEVAQDDLAYPEHTRCAPDTTGTQGLIDDNLPDDQCDVYQKECRNVHPNKIRQGLNLCRAMLLRNPWKSDCNCMRDFCGIELRPAVDPEHEAPCAKARTNERNLVAYNGFDYATLDFGNPKAASGESCQADAYMTADKDGQRYAQVPQGWEIVPENDDNVEELLQANPFGTKCILTKRPEPYAIDGYDGCGQHELVERFQDETYQCYAVKLCPSKVLLRRKTVRTLDQSRPSRIGWTCTVDDGETSPVFGSRRVARQDNLENWFQQSMARRGPVSNLSKKNNLVINFARDEETNKVYMCMVGGNSRDSSIAVVETEIETSPKYALFYMVQSYLTRRDRYLPVLHGHKLTSTNYFPQGQDPHGFCIGPLDVSGRSCFTMKLSGNQDFDNVYVMGPSGQSLKTYVTAPISDTGVNLKFCPAGAQTSHCRLRRH